MGKVSSKEERKEDETDENRTLKVKDVIEILKEVNPEAVFKIDYESSFDQDEWASFTVKDFKQNCMYVSIKKKNLSENNEMIEDIETFGITY